MLPVDHVTRDGTLIISQVTAEDAGVYECIAVGQYRTTRSRMELFILGLCAPLPSLIYTVALLWRSSLSFYSCVLLKIFQRLDDTFLDDR